MARVSHIRAENGPISTDPNLKHDFKPKLCPKIKLGLDLKTMRLLLAYG